MFVFTMNFLSSLFIQVLCITLVAFDNFYLKNFMMIWW